ncbi:M23 family metallopeptidase [Mycobacterium yunnanensis]|uniref:M23 family metallopeptidase n=1 Tax=Mycobacterium yunnanensis TaxID=368477 RepID=A0A9X2YS45_9MYCO|nr:M23 family metallopeptidase [Mycobacterium yunnanensis]MCV7424587.1 M23 family metallopeptidase [Mycobacterium yunnanensis]
MHRIGSRTAGFLGAAILLAGCGTPTQGPPTSSSAARPSAASPGAPPSGPPAQVTPVLASVIAAPVPVPTTDGKRHLAYEVQLTNVLDGDVTVKSLSVKAGDDDLLTLAGDQLAYWMRALGASQTPTTTLGPGRAGVVWLDVVLDESAPVPTELSHTIVADLAKPLPPLLPPTVTENAVAPVTVSTHEPAKISPPLDGPRWLDGNSCCDMTAHRMALNPLDGNLWAAERFAVDYLQLSADGTIFTGDRGAPQSYPYFGVDVHAVADGPVVAVLDGLPEQVAGQSPTGLPLDQYAGNHVVQDISGDGTEKRYALYAHLQTGSVKVRPGDQLSTGQVLGHLGNTGNSDAPHLHFHVMSSPDPLRSNGLPFVIKDFTLDGRLASMNALYPLLAGQPAPMAPGSTPRQEKDLGPLVLDVMTYAAR